MCRPLFILTPYLCSLSFAAVFRLNCYPIKFVLYFPWDNCVDNVDNKPRFNPRLSMLPGHVVDFHEQIICQIYQNIEPIASSSLISGSSTPRS